MDNEKLTIAMKFLEEAGDRAARKGAKSEHVLRGMLEIFVASRVGLGRCSDEELVAEVLKTSHEIRKALSDGSVKTELGPPLGEGDN